MQLYAVTMEGHLHHYPAVVLKGQQDLPSAGNLSFESDRELIRELEDTMLKAHGPHARHFH